MEHSVVEKGRWLLVDLGFSSSGYTLDGCGQKLCLVYFDCFGVDCPFLLVDTRLCLDVHTVTLLQLGDPLRRFAEDDDVL